MVEKNSNNWLKYIVRSKNLFNVGKLSVKDNTPTFQETTNARRGKFI